MNVVLGFVALIACTLIGYLYSVKYSNKKVFYQSFSFFNSRLLTEVSFSKKSLIALLNEKNNKNDFYAILNERFVNNNKVFDKIECLERLKYLSLDEKSVVYDYISNVGGSDKTSQMQYLQAMDKQLKERLDIAIKEDSKYKSLCIKMGFLIGLAIFIIVL